MAPTGMPDVTTLAAGTCGDPFATLGPHPVDGGWELRLWRPGAVSAVCLCADEADDARGHAAGRPDPQQPFFSLRLDQRPTAYRWRLSDAEGRVWVEDDPYRFGLLLSDWDLARLAEGRHHDLGAVLGAHPQVIDGAAGVRFAVWAPNARRVAVIGDWNGFEPRSQPMRLRLGSGVWELFIPGLAVGQRYKFQVLGADGRDVAKADPCARACEIPPATASIIAAPEAHVWDDEAWLAARASADWRRRPMAIYEIHAASWRRHPDGRSFSYREMAPALVAHCLACGFTHVEFLPLTAHPYQGSWGYQPSGWFAHDPRLGSADDLRFLIDVLHAAGLGVFMDFVPAHFPKDDFALARFDGSACYEYEDPREGEHLGWGTKVFNFRRPEVRNYLLASAIHWVRSFHVDGLRIDAVSAMLYRNYDRNDGAWIANEDGGNDNREAASWLRELNATIHATAPGVITVAEESTAWQGVTAPTDWQGLGFDLKWNMGWMHDSLSYLGIDPLFRAGMHQRITFHQWYAYDERWVLPLSHDEVVHGKRSLLDKFPGDWWQRRATLRVLLGYQAAVPGRKLLFMGGEFGQGREWDWQGQVAWDEGLQDERAGICRFLGEALHHYAREGAMHRADDERSGFRWVSCDDASSSVVAFLRQAPDERPVLVIINFTPVARRGYRLGVTADGPWELLLDSDATRFGGAGLLPPRLHAKASPAAGPWPAELTLDLPALSIQYWAPRIDDEAATRLLQPAQGPQK